MLSLFSVRWMWLKMILSTEFWFRIFNSNPLNRYLMNQMVVRTTEHVWLYRYFTFIDTKSCVLSIFDQYSMYFLIVNQISKQSSNEIHFICIQMNQFTRWFRCWKHVIRYIFQRERETSQRFIRNVCVIYLDVEMACHTKAMAEKYYGPYHNQILSTGNQFKLRRERRATY